MKFLYDSNSIHNLEHVRIGADIAGREITIIATEEDSETKEITVIGTAKFKANKAF